MSTYFYVYPFGVSGSRASIPTTNPATTPNPVNYQLGYGVDYTKVLGTDPNALPVDEPSFNQLIYDITNNIQQYQTLATPLWITSLQNLGSSYPYPLYARAAYDAGSGLQIWENQVASNTATPGADDTWLPCNVTAVGNPTGTIIDFAGIALPSGYLACDGSAQPRSSYTNLLNAITSTQTVTVTATQYTFTVSSAFGLYVGMNIESSAFATGTVITIISGTTITVSNQANTSASVTVTFFNYGNGDGSTTFNLPNCQRKVTIGQGGVGSSTPYGVAGTTMGQIGGQESHVQQSNEVGAHSHTGTVGYRNDSPGGSISIYGSFHTSNNTQPLSIANNSPASTAFNVMQPSLITYKCIKY